MKCSNCSHVIRPVVAIDIDGTLGNYHGHFLEFAEMWLGLHPGPAVPPWTGGAAPGNSFRDWFCFAYQVDLSTFRTIKLAYRQGGLKRSMPIYANAEALVNGLAHQAEVWLTTTRPHDRFDRVDPDTRAWLDRYGIQYHGLLFGDDKMGSLAERVDPERVVFVLDDLVPVLERARTLFPSGATVLRKTRYNERGPGWPIGCSDLLDARAMAVAHAQDWNLKHEFDSLPTTYDR